MRTLNAGLPFYDSINKQARYSPYFNSYIKAWICAKNRLPAFQFNIPEGNTATMDTFDLIDIDKDTSTDLTAYFIANVSTIDRDVYGYWFTHLGNIASTLKNGRYYFHAITDSEGLERFSEVFTVTNLEE